MLDRSRSTSHSLASKSDPIGEKKEIVGVLFLLKFDWHFVFFFGFPEPTPKPMPAHLFLFVCKKKNAPVSSSNEERSLISSAIS